MGRSTAIYIALILTLCIAGFKPGDGVNGKWEGVAMSSQGDYNLVYMFNVQGDSLTGSVVVPSMGDTVAITNGKINGNNFSFDVDYNYETYHHNGSLKGDTVTMKINGSGGDDFTGKFTRAEDD